MKRKEIIEDIVTIIDTVHDVLCLDACCCDVIKEKIEMYRKGTI